MFFFPVPRKPEVIPRPDMPDSDKEAMDDDDVTEEENSEISDEEDVSPSFESAVRQATR